VSSVPKKTEPVKEPIAVDVPKPEEENKAVNDSV
jgi:hypothetical protein